MIEQRKSNQYVLEPVISTVAAVLRKHGARDVFVFGSAATGRAGVNSDLDVAIRGLPPERFFAAVAAASRSSDRSIDVIDLDEDSAFVRHLISEGLLQRVD